MRRTPLLSGEREDRVPRRSQVGDLGLVTGRAQPGLRLQHDVDVVLSEGGYVRPSPGCADGSCIEEADKDGRLDETSSLPSQNSVFTFNKFTAFTSTLYSL